MDLKEERIRIAMFERNLELLEFTGVGGMIKYRCVRGHISEMIFIEFMLRYLFSHDMTDACDWCNKIDDVKLILEDKGAMFLDMCKSGIHIVVSYQCSCGNQTTSRLYTIKTTWKGYCRKCAQSSIECRRDGKYNPNYNHDITEEERMNRKGRKYTGYTKWRKNVLERDDCVCLKCQKYGRIAHHIESHSDNPHLRIVLSNGATLCGKCHEDFHRQYSRHHFTGNDFKEFLKKEDD